MNQIKRIREASNLTLRSLARHIGISPSGISQLEKQERSLTEENALRISAYLNCDMNMLFTGDGNYLVFVGESVAKSRIPQWYYTRAYERGDIVEMETEKELVRTMKGKSASLWKSMQIDRLSDLEIRLIGEVIAKSRRKRN